MNNWITKYIKPKIKSLFKRRSKNTEDSLWVACDCQEPIFKEDLVKNLYVCPKSKCEKHHKLSSRERFDIFFDEGNYEIIEVQKFSDDPLEFEDRIKYKDRLKAAREKTNQHDAMLAAKGKVNGINVTCAAQNFDFIGGSFGIQSCAVFIQAVKSAIENKTPLVSFASTGGIRLMESAISLNSMPKSVIAVSDLKASQIPYIVVFSEPAVTGGVMASWAGLSDVAISEPGIKNLGFAGKRVIKNTIGGSDLPEDFQHTSSVFKFGKIDAIVERKDLKDTISNLLKILLKVEEKNINANDSNVVQIEDPLRKSTA